MRRDSFGGVEQARLDDVEVVRRSSMIAVRVGDVVGVVQAVGDVVSGRMWDGVRSIETL
jgi:hypothetical protein